VSASEDLADVAAAIDALAERLADRSIALLHEALATAEAERLASTERVVTRARRALEKASSLLRGIPDDAP
jgi:hypothetical protein